MEEKIGLVDNMDNNNLHDKIMKAEPLIRKSQKERGSFIITSPAIAEMVRKIHEIYQRRNKIEKIKSRMNGRIK